MLVQDDPDQFAGAAGLLAQAAEEGEVCYLSDGVLCETAWVLAAVYGASRDEILAALGEIAADERYEVDGREGLVEALQAYRTGRAGFADYLIGARARHRGARVTYTFDRRLRNASGFAHLR